jgi:hypothetical protein
LANSTNIQYRIELYRAFLREDSNPHKSEGSLLSIGDKLHLLREVNQAWRDLEFTRSSTIECPFSSSGFYELSGGRFVMGAASDPGSNQINITQSLYVYKLPNRSDRVREENKIQTTYIKLEFPIADFAMDVSQNLLVLMEGQAFVFNYIEDTTQPDLYSRGYTMTLHLRTFDTNTPHPDAAIPQLSVTERVWGAIVHISGSILASLFMSISLHDILVVWDWKTGDIIGVCQTIEALTLV